MTRFNPRLVPEFLSRHPSVDGYDLICFLQSYSRLVNASVAELLQEGLDSEATGRVYVSAIHRISGQE
jgi:hypothetical protein